MKLTNNKPYILKIQISLEVSGIKIYAQIYISGLEDAWFWKNWKDNESSVVEFMKENYPPNFTYQDFGRELKMEFFNASWIADLVKDSGAKYACLIVLL